MAGFLGDDQVRQIKDATDLVDLMAQYTTVRRAGHDYKACCPIHNERSPSLHIYVDQQTYHCFGCGAHGDVISLVREKEALEFVDALEFLARRSGIELVYEKGKKGMERSERERLFDIMELATAFYEHQLWETEAGAPARAYLESRGLSEDICRRFRLGWAPGRGALVAAGRRRHFDNRDMLRLDIAVDRDGRVADRFYDRLMFPICDRFGKPIAFSGRLLPAAERAAKEAGRGVGKYINSRDTPLYNKGSVVFNLHQARSEARTAARLMVMEGPTDVMAAAQAGAPECVAVLGTALTAEHAKQLGSVMGDSGRLILLFDGDAAGQKNSVKAIKTCLLAAVPTRAAVVPDGHDPAELLSEQGVAGFNVVIEGQQSDIDYLLRTLAPRPYELDQRALLKVIDEILQVLKPITDGELLGLYLQTLAQYVNIEETRLQRRLHEVIELPLPPRQRNVAQEQTTRRTASPAQSVPDRNSPPDSAGEDDEYDEYGHPHDESHAGYEEYVEEPVLPSLDREQAIILHILMRHAALRGPAFDDFGCEPAHFPYPWRIIVERFVSDPELSGSELAASPGLEQWAEVRRRAFACVQRSVRSDGIDVDQHTEPLIKEAISKLRIGQTALQIKAAEHELKEAQHRGDFAKARTLFEDIMRLRRESHG